MTTLPVVSDALACCSPVTGGVIDDAEAHRLAHIFKALSDPARVKLISLIAANQDSEECVCNLTEPLGLSQPTVSHHMKLLVDAGIVTREQRGKWAYYRIVPATLAALAAAITPGTQHVAAALG